MVGVGFKEWAAVCHRLAAGRQALILRKGGIHEESGLFRPDHDRFWLYPTRFHESQQTGLKPDAVRDFAACEPYPVELPPGAVLLRALAEVHAVYRLDTLETALALDAFHCWTPETVAQRFHYRRPGLFALVVRVGVLPATWTFPETPEFAGCKTWVPLGEMVPEWLAARAVPALGAAEFAAVAAGIAAVVADG